MFRPDIVAVMVTGKTPARYPLARAAVASFCSQKYAGNKLLLIVNDNQQPLYENRDEIPQSVVELHLRPARPLTLGDLRNIGLEHAVIAAPDGYMMQWDDDDFSRPDRMQWQVDNTKPGQATIFRWQSQCELKTGACFAGCGRDAKVRGFAGTMFFPTNTAVRFLSKAKGEDTFFLEALRKTMPLTVLSNRPTMFVRLYHGDNTWHREHVMRRRPGSRDLQVAEMVELQAMIAANYPQAARLRAARR